jgi:hypothetical protein
MRVFVNTDDVDHGAHFHVQIGKYDPSRLNNKGQPKWVSQLETRIRLDVAEYYTNDTKKDARLPKGVAAHIDLMIRQPRGGRYNGTRWEYACDEWNNAFNNDPFIPPTEQPDYSNL